MPRVVTARLGALGAAVAAVVAATACGGAAGDLNTQAPTLAAAATPADLDDDIVGFAPGEQLSFEVRVAGVLAGEAQFAAGKPGVVDGRRAIAVSSVIKSAGAFALIKEVKDEVTSIIDLERTRPMRTTSDVIFGARRYHADTAFSDHGAKILYTPHGESTRELVYDFGDAVVHDAHSSMALVRTWTADPGERIALWVIGGRRLWRTEIWVVGTEVIGTHLGNQPAIRIDGTSVRSRPDLTPEPNKPPRSFSVWLSDDADRVPLRFSAHTELGDIVIDLVAYERP
ncbi:MAG TPA: DUF3108 domain-containing protein [Kofleriaceae bacterium]|nr:DUF3108 domain-containing protein [Kofleriaceae bacterium]